MRREALSDLACVQKRRRDLVRIRSRPAGKFFLFGISSPLDGGSRFRGNFAGGLLTAFPPA
jgi:hypothetical protein